MNFSFFSRKKDVVNATTNTSNSTNTTADANRSSNPNISILEAFKEFGNQSGVTLHWSDEEDDEGMEKGGESADGHGARKCAVRQLVTRISETAAGLVCAERRMMIALNFRWAAPASPRDRPCQCWT